MSYGDTVLRLDVRKGSYTHLVGHTKGYSLYPNPSRLRDDDEEGRSVCYSDTLDFFVGSDTDDVRFWNTTTNTIFQSF